MGRLDEGDPQTAGPADARIAALESQVRELQARNQQLEEQLHLLRAGADGEESAAAADSAKLINLLKERRARMHLVKRKLREKMALVDSLKGELELARLRADELAVQLAASHPPGTFSDEDSVVDFADAADESDAIAALQGEVARLKEKVRAADRTTSQLMSARRRVAELERKVLDDGSTQQLMKELREQNRQLAEALEQSRAKIRKQQNELLEIMSTRPQQA